MDDYTRFTWMHPMKSEMCDSFLALQKLPANMVDCKIKKFQGNSGRKYNNSSLKKHVLCNSIYFRKLCLGTPTQNQIAECKHCYIIKLHALFFSMLIGLDNFG